MSSPSSLNTSFSSADERENKFMDFMNILYHALARKLLSGDETLVLSQEYIDLTRSVLVLSFIYRPVFREKFQAVLSFLTSDKGIPNGYMLAHCFAIELSQYYSAYKFLTLCSFISELYFFLCKKQAREREKYYVQHCCEALDTIYTDYFFDSFEKDQRKWEHIFSLASKIANKFTLLETYINDEISNEIHKHAASRGATAGGTYRNEVNRNQPQILVPRENSQQVQMSLPLPIIPGTSQMENPEPEFVPGTSLQVFRHAPPLMDPCRSQQLVLLVNPLSLITEAASDHHAQDPNGLTNRSEVSASWVVHETKQHPTSSQDATTDEAGVNNIEQNRNSVSEANLGNRTFNEFEHHENEDFSRILSYFDS